MIDALLPEEGKDFRAFELPPGLKQQSGRAYFIQRVSEIEARADFETMRTDYRRNGKKRKSAITVLPNAESGASDSDLPDDRRVAIQR
jgi:hypothetical protein